MSRTTPHIWPWTELLLWPSSPVRPSQPRASAPSTATGSGWAEVEHSGSVWDVEVGPYVHHTPSHRWEFTSASGWLDSWCALGCPNLSMRGTPSICVKIDLNDPTTPNTRRCALAITQPISWWLPTMSEAWSAWPQRSNPCVQMRTSKNYE